MIIAVHDASILIDLIAINLIEQIFALDYHMVTTDFIIEELRPEQRSILLTFIANGRLTIDISNEQDIIDIVALSDRYASLSLADCSVLFYAQRYSAILLTGDKRLRNTALDSALEVHGILWVLELLVDTKIIMPHLAAQRLEELINSNVRLPVEECRKRITAWKRMSLYQNP